jgi:predicted RNase H-like HicB family nuclease
MTTYAVIYEPADDGTVSAYLPDLPGVVASGVDRAEVDRRIREAVELYREHTGALPEPRVEVGTVAA